MALYEYQCAKCGRKTEVIQRFSDPAPAECPHCGGTLTKLLSSPAVQFKGSGFHATDYARSGGKPEDSPKGKEEDSSKGKEAVGAPSEAGAETKGDPAGDSSKEKKDAKDSSREKSDSAPGAAKKAASGGPSIAPSRRNTRTK